MGIIGTFFDVFWSIKFNFVAEFRVSSLLQKEIKNVNKFRKKIHILYIKIQSKSFENELFLIENNF